MSCYATNKLHGWNTSFKFFTGNCNPIDVSLIPLIQGENNDIRMMIMTNSHCGIEILGIDGEYFNSLHGGLAQKIIPHTCTELEFEISDKKWNEIHLDSDYERANSLVGYQLFVYPFENGTEEGIYNEGEMPKKPVKVWIDWVEVGKKKYLKPSEKKRDYKLHGNLPMDGNDGYTFNFGTTVPEPYIDNCLLAVGIQNIFEEPINLSLERNDYIDQNIYHKYGNGAIRYAFDGSQKVEGYVAMKFNRRDDCLHKYENSIDLSNIHHRKVRALIKFAESGYLRIFGSVVDSSYFTEPRLNSLISGNGVFDDFKAITPGEWQILDFDLGSTSENGKTYTDFSKIVGVTISVTKEKTDTGLPYKGEVLVDWIEVGSAVGIHYDIDEDFSSESLSGNEELQDGGFDFDYADIDTTGMNLYSLHCLPSDSISNDIFNTLGVENVKVGFTKEGAQDNSGVLNISFENLTS